MGGRRMGRTKRGGRGVDMKTDGGGGTEMTRWCTNGGVYRDGLVTR
jgi:hypothetical protein